MSDQIISWLERAGAKKIRARGENIVCCCPFHNDKLPSFAIHSRTGLYVCYSAGCGASGNFVRFLREMFDMTWMKAFEIAESVVETPADFEDEDLLLPEYGERRHRDKEALPLIQNASMWLAAYNLCPQYMLDRGFKKHILKAWSIGYDMEHRAVTIPVFHPSGGLVGFTRRDTTGRAPEKYLHGSAENPRCGFPKARILYGQHMFRSDSAVVTEGSLDPIAMHQMLGHNGCACLSTMGSRVSDDQKGELRKYHRLILLRDMDADGEHWARSILTSLIEVMSDCEIYVATSYTLGACKDVTDLMSAGGGVDDIRVDRADLWLVGSRGEHPINDKFTKKREEKNAKRISRSSQMEADK